MTRAAATRSGSWLTVPATQSMYDGSKAAICAERVVVELAERDDRRLGLGERRRRATAEMTQPVADERSGRRRGSGGSGRIDRLG